MPSSLLKNRIAATALLCAATAFPAVDLTAQEKPQVAPPSKSDTFGEDEHGRKIRIQHREVAGANFQIAGVDLTASPEVLEQAAKILGKVETAASGDASTWLEEACYRSSDEHDSTRLIFQRGEVSPSFVLSSQSTAWKWKTPCKRSPKVTRSIATASGLHLGQTQEQVIALLGLPTTHRRIVQTGQDDLAYELESMKWMSPRALAPYLQDAIKQHPNLDQKEWIKRHGFYALEVYIDAKFIRDGLTTLEISWSEEY